MSHLHPSHHAGRHGGPVSTRHGGPVSTRHGGPVITRRMALGGMGAALTLAHLRPARAAVSFPQRLVVINIRGGLDGMSAVVPYGDPNLAGLRAPLIPPPVGQNGGMLDMGGFYGLNPNLPNLYSLYQANQMLAVHAVGNLLLTRSHFAGQGAIELGQTQQTGPTSGWVDRLVGLLQSEDGGVEPGVSFGAGNPLISQGSTPMGAWTSSAWPATNNTLAALVETLGETDPLIGPPTESGFNDRSYFQQWLAASNAPKGGSALQTAMRAAGIFIAASGGPAIAVVESNAADTHVAQVSRLATLFADLDASIALLQTAAGPSTWANTVVLTVTEFGRMAAINGCGGTDHGTGLAMFLAGGPVAGGRVVADWPGLSQSQLYQNRDLYPTTDIRAVIMGVLQGHLGMSSSQLATIFPNATGVTPMAGLVNG
jgi:uncharacterized protein (DUF1501 family)